MISGLTVNVESSNLWSDVVWSSTERVRSSSGDHAFLAHAKVGKLAMTVSVKQNVVKFKITTADHHRQGTANHCQKPLHQDFYVLTQPSFNRHCMRSIEISDSFPT